jgi:hypothetical protein
MYIYTHTHIYIYIYIHSTNTTHFQLYVRAWHSKYINGASTRISRRPAEFVTTKFRDVPLCHVHVRGMHVHFCAFRAHEENWLRGHRRGHLRSNIDRGGGVHAENAEVASTMMPRAGALMRLTTRSTVRTFGQPIRSPLNYAPSFCWCLRQVLLSCAGVDHPME